MSLPFLVFLSVAGDLQAADAVPGEEFCEALVDRIEFVGNEKTIDRVMLEELPFAEGEACSLDGVVDGLQRIMDLGLFRSVLASFEQKDGLTVLTYRVVEKIYFLPLPRVSRTSDGELRLGAQLRWDNFLGRNHRLKITGERREEDDGSGPAGKHFEIEYRIPRFLTSDAGLATEIQYKQKRKDMEQDGVEFGIANTNDSLFKLQVSRWVNQGGVTAGLRYHLGLLLHHRDLEILSGDSGPFSDGTAVAINFGLVKRDVRDELFRLNGYALRMDLKLASGQIGSDFSYRRADVDYRRYLALPGLSLRNLNYRLRAGVSNAGVFGERHYSLGGGENHRSLQKRAKTGDVLLLANIEYLVALPGNQALRGVLFADIGNVYRYNELNPFHQKFGGGAGLRYKLLSFSNTDLRFDAAWDSRAESLRYYISTDLTF